MDDGVVEKVWEWEREPERELDVEVDVVVEVEWEWEWCEEKGDGFGRKGFGGVREKCEGEGEYVLGLK